MSQNITDTKSFGEYKRKLSTDEGECSKKMKVDVKAQLKQCRIMLYDFLNREKCLPYTRVFLTKVDPVLYQCPDYFDVIKNPMDLTTMMEKMDRGEYATPEEFADDIRLIINNCRLYNSPDHEITPLCDQFEENFKRRYEKIINPQPRRRRTLSADSNEPLRRSSRSAPVLPDDEEYIMKEITKTQQYLAHLYEKLNQIIAEKVKNVKARPSQSNVPKKVSRKKPANKKRAVVPKVEPKVEKVVQESIQNNLHASSDEDEDEGIPMTYEEKRALIQDINKLPNDKLKEATELIEKLEPTISTKDESCEIDFSILNTKTLRRLEKLTNDYYHPKVPRAAPFPRKEKLEKNEALVTELKKDLEQQKKKYETQLADIEDKLGIYMRRKLLEDNSQKSNSSSTSSGSSSSDDSGSSSSSSSDNDD